MPRVKSDGGKKDTKRSRNQFPDMQEIVIKKKKTGLATESSAAIATAPVLEIPKIPRTEPKSPNTGMRTWLTAASSKELDTFSEFLQQKRAVNLNALKQRQLLRQSAVETKDPKTSPSRSRHPDEGFKKRTSMRDQRVKCGASDILRMEEALGDPGTIPWMPVKQKLSDRWNPTKKSTTH